MDRRAYLALGGATVTAAVVGCLGGNGIDPDNASGDGTGGTDGSGESSPGDERGSDDTTETTLDPDIAPGWTDSLGWLPRNTPESGTDAGVDGEYSVLSWWVYGGPIADRGERKPTVSSSDERTPTAEFLLAQTEREALDVLDTQFRGDTAPEPQYVMVDALMAEAGPREGRLGAEVDAHPEFERDDLYTRLSSQTEPAETVGVVHHQPYHESMLIRLYHYHGSRTEPAPFVTQWTGDTQRTDTGDPVVTIPEEENTVRFVGNVTVAREEAAGGGTEQVGGIGANPVRKVSGLEQFRLVYDDAVPAVPAAGGDDGAYQDAREEGLTGGPASVAVIQATLLSSATDSPRDRGSDTLDSLYRTTPSFTKTFERVPGATLQGSFAEGPTRDSPPENVTDNDLLEMAPGDSLAVSVPIDPPNGREFTYARQTTLDENLAFELTVPYSTTGYDEYGPAEGYTDVRARATEPYTIETRRVLDSEAAALVWFGADVDVREGQVIGEEEPTVDVGFEERTEEFDFDLDDSDDEG